MKTWIVQVKSPDKQPFWVGNVKAPGRIVRTNAQAPMVLSGHMPHTTVAVSGGRWTC